MHEFAHLNLYDIQKEFIQKAQNIISQSKFGIFSSPTGTGKTLSLLCSISKFTNQEDEVSNLSKENQALMEELFGKQEKKCKTFYCSRTHDQLNQAIKELKKVNKNVNAIIVGSRKLYCVNENINKTNDVNIINEKCKELLNNDQCKYYNNTFDEIEDIAANRNKKIKKDIIEKRSNSNEILFIKTKPNCSINAIDNSKNILKKTIVGKKFNFKTEKKILMK